MLSVFNIVNVSYETLLLIIAFLRFTIFDDLVHSREAKTWRGSSSPSSSGASHRISEGYVLAKAKDDYLANYDTHRGKWQCK
jgi:hypothetical protein